METEHAHAEIIGCFYFILFYIIFYQMLNTTEVMIICKIYQKEMRQKGIVCNPLVRQQASRERSRILESNRSPPRIILIAIFKTHSKRI